MKTIFLIFILIISIFSAIAANNIDKITASYLGVKDALVSSNGTLAKERAKTLLDALSETATGLQPAQQKLLATYLEKLKFDSRHISETNVIDHQREHFASLSKNMYALLSGLKINTATLYQQYCPMKKTYWLSEGKAIRNPYFGSQMLECGKVTAILKGNGK